MYWHQLLNQTVKFTPVWTTILKMRAIFVHQTLTERALCGISSLRRSQHV